METNHMEAFPGYIGTLAPDPMMQAWLPVKPPSPSNISKFPSAAGAPWLMDCTIRSSFTPASS